MTDLTTFKFGDQDPYTTPIFLGENGACNIGRSDKIKYPVFKKQADRMIASFWKPQEISLTKDKADFRALDLAEQRIFLMNLKRQVTLDHLQSLGLVQAFMPITSDPMIKRCLNVIEFFEEIHQMAYEHVASNGFNDIGEVYDGMSEIKEIVKCSNQISHHYDRLLDMTAGYRLGEYGYSEYEVLKAAWMALQSINALEGIRFFVSFACSFAFGESGRMVGNASIIKMISNDELLHVAFTTKLLRVLPEDREEFKQIEHETRQECTELFHDVVQEEKDWAKSLFQEGSTIGLNNVFLSNYLDFIAAKRMRAVGLEYKNPSPRTNPLPFMGRWLNENETQVAPQETEITSYVHSISHDVNAESFSGISL